MSAAIFLALVISVHDGDTLRVRTGPGTSQSIRIAHIDAPEISQDWGCVSSHSLRTLCLGKIARVQPLTIDRYGRTVADVRCNKTDASHHQIERGMAWVFEKYEPGASPIYATQARAQRHRRGLWFSADPTPPWQWRHQKANHTK